MHRRGAPRSRAPGRLGASAPPTGHRRLGRARGAARHCHAGSRPGPNSAGSLSRRAGREPLRSPLRVHATISLAEISPSSRGEHRFVWWTAPRPRVGNFSGHRAFIHPYGLVFCCSRRQMGHSFSPFCPLTPSPCILRAHTRARILTRTRTRARSQAGCRWRRRPQRARASVWCAVCSGQTLAGSAPSVNMSARASIATVQLGTVSVHGVMRSGFRQPCTCALSK